MFNWLREYLEIRAEFRERSTKLTHDVSEIDKVCKSCETLREQLAIANYEKQELLKKLLKEPEPEVPREAPQITIPKMIPWNVRRQMLEREDRERARAMRNAPQPDAKADVAELEKQLDLAAEARENQDAGQTGQK